MEPSSGVSEQQHARAAIGAAGAVQESSRAAATPTGRSAGAGASQPSVSGAESSEPGWWILVKIALFLLIPTAMIYAIKILLG